MTTIMIRDRAEKTKMDWKHFGMQDVKQTFHFALIAKCFSFLNPLINTGIELQL